MVAAGAVSTTYGVPGVAEHAIALKDLDDAVALRRAVLERFERAAVDHGMLARRSLDVVVCGGGPTGVETAGAMMELFTKVLAKDFRDLDVASVRVTVVEAAPRLLGMFGPASSERARRTLERRGVVVRLGVGVDRVSADGQGDRRVELTDGTSLPAGVVVWAAGVRASPLAEALGVELGRGGRIVVDDDLSVPGRPEVFAIGDVAASRSAGDDAPLPQVAQPAIQGGRHAARQIVRRLEGRRERAVPLPRQGIDGDDRPPRRRRRVPASVVRHPAPGRVRRLAGLARPAHRVPDRLPQPRQRARQLGVELPDVRPGEPHAAVRRAGVGSAYD